MARKIFAEIANIGQEVATDRTRFFRKTTSSRNRAERALGIDALLSLRAARLQGAPHEAKANTK